MHRQHWDFFLAHARPDSEWAERLRILLEPHATVFEDSLLPAGVEWDSVLPQHLANSAIIVVMVSNHTGGAYYERDEIAQAISLARESPTRHRVVPVYLPDFKSDIPYGLQVRTGIRLSETFTIRDAARALLFSLEDLKAESSVGPLEAASEAVTLFGQIDTFVREALDGGNHESTLGTNGSAFFGILDGHLSSAIAAAAEELSPSQSESWGLRLRTQLSANGLDARLIVASLPGHEDALELWSRLLMDHGQATHHMNNGSRVTKAVIPRVREALAATLEEARPNTLSSATSNLLIALFRDQPHDVIFASSFVAAVSARLPALRSNSRAVERFVARQPAESSGGKAVDLPPRPLLDYVAAQMCKLPARDPHTLGRSGVVNDLLDRIKLAMHKDGAAVMHLSGQPGVGKSTVAVELGHALSGDFLGGAIYLDLKGLHPSVRLTRTTIVRMIFQSLGRRLDPKVVEDELLAEFGSALDGSRALVILDNAADAAHVAGLARTFASCLVIVTSRDRVQDFATLELAGHIGPLERQASVDLLMLLTRGDKGLERHYDRIADLCDDVPLAMRLIAARMATRPLSSVEYFAGLLEEAVTRLDYLEVGERALRAAIRLSYDALSIPTRRVLRFLSAAPGREVSSAELSMGIDESSAQTELHLNRLVDASLADVTILRMPSGRPISYFGLHDLVNLFAAERLSEEEPKAVILSFRHRCVEYLVTRLNEIIGGSANAELGLELDPYGFREAMKIACRESWNTEAIELATGLAALYTTQGELEEFVRVQELLVQLHVQSQHPERAVAACLHQAGVLRTIFRAGRAAGESLQRARHLTREYGLIELGAQVSFELSLIYADNEEWARALRLGEEAVMLLRGVNKESRAVPVALNNAKVAHIGELADSVEYWREEAWDLAVRYGGLEERAAAAFQRAVCQPIGLESISADMFRAASELYAELGNHTNAAVAAENGSGRARRAGDLKVSEELLDVAVAHWADTEHRARLAAALVDMSSIYAHNAEWQRVSETLERARKLLAQPQSAPLAAEVAVRLGAARVLAGEAHEWNQELQSASASEYLRLVGTTAQNGFSRGRLDTDERKILIKALRLKTLHPPEDFKFWLEDALGGDQAERGALKPP